MGSAAGQPALDGRLLLQEALRAWEAFLWLRGQGRFSKDLQVLLSSGQRLVYPIQAPGQVAGIPGHQHQMTDRQEQGRCPRKNNNRIRSPQEEGTSCQSPTGLKSLVCSPDRSPFPRRGVSMQFTDAQTNLGTANLNKAT